VVPTAFIMARTVRLRLAWSLTTRAATPNFRKAETLLTHSILTALGRYNDAAQECGEPFRRREHLISR
jgi:hypothetical protein